MTHETRCPIFGILVCFDHMSSEFSVTRKTETVYISVYIIGTLPHVIDILLYNRGRRAHC
jgi:hypothetical protein